jgi:hypothetical protein
MPPLRRLVTLALVAGCGQPPAAVMDAGIPDWATSIPCDTDSDCPPDQPMCHPLAKICVGCIAGQDTCLQDGSTNFVCDPMQHKCIPKPPDWHCHFDSECSGTTVICAVDLGLCVTCLVQDDCADAMDLDLGIATPVCNTPDVAAPLAYWDAGTGQATYKCMPGCSVCAGPRPICQVDLGACCPTNGGACVAGVPTPPADM